MIKVQVPATSANLGPGFDYVGMALKLYNEIYFFDAFNEEFPAGSVLLRENSLTHRALNLVAGKVRREMPPLQVAIKAGVPKARGLGSSATLTVAGLVAGNAILQAGLAEDDLINLATMLEGHPDNATPALIGGLVVCMASDGQVRYIKIIPQKKMQVVAVIPEFEVSTADARKVLPNAVSLRDAVDNTGRFGFFIASVLTGNYEHLSFAMDDLLHQPYRLQLVPGMKEVMAAAKEAGALGSCLSGAGPTVLALCEAQADEVMNEMKRAWLSFGIQAEAKILEIEEKGASFTNTSCY